MSYLKESFKAVTFPFMNKIGLNSRPNGFPFMFGNPRRCLKKIKKKLGLTTEGVIRSSFGMKDIPADLKRDKFCYQFLDNYTSLVQEFNEYGYKVVKFNALFKFNVLV